MPTADKLVRRLPVLFPDDIDAYWRSFYPDCAPIPYWLRDAYRDRWVRFHSLPESKRYPTDESEYQTILERHNAVLGELASANEQLVLISSGYSNTLEPVRSYTHLNDLDPTARCWRTIPSHELQNDPDDPLHWHLFMSVWTWVPRVFDPILRLVADDTVANTMIVSTSRHWIYHPYDGGADVILNTTEQRTRLRRMFTPWLSSRSDGL